MRTNRDQTEEISLCPLFVREVNSVVCVVWSGWSGDPQEAARAGLQWSALSVSPQVLLGHRNNSIPLQGLTSCGSPESWGSTETFRIQLPYSGNLWDSCCVDLGDVVAAWWPMLRCFCTQIPRNNLAIKQCVQYCKGFFVLFFFVFFGGGCCFWILCWWSMTHFSKLNAHLYLCLFQTNCSCCCQWSETHQRIFPWKYLHDTKCVLDK